MRDTPEHIERMVQARMMALSGEERFLMCCSMCDSARQIVLASFPPGLSELERKIRLVERYYGDDPELVRRFVAQLKGHPDPLS